MKKLVITIMLFLSACEKVASLPGESSPQARRTVCQVIRENDFSQIHPEGWTAYCLGEVDAKLDVILKELQSLKQNQ